MYTVKIKEECKKTSGILYRFQCCQFLEMTYLYVGGPIIFTHKDDTFSWISLKIDSILFTNRCLKSSPGLVRGA